MANILIIDDDPHIRELISAILRAEGFTSYEATDGQAALDMLASVSIDLCIVDVMMPTMDGIAFSKLARRYYNELPLLMLTAKGQLGNKIEGFDAGVDDYLVKPFEAPELVVRIKALLRRYKKVTEHIAQAGSVTLDSLSHTVDSSLGRIELPLKEFDLLFALASRPDRTLSRNQLLDEVWGFDFDGNERTLDVHINRLRERFARPEYGFSIVTVRGLGYRLEAQKEDA